MMSGFAGLRTDKWALFGGKPRKCGFFSPSQEPRALKATCDKTKVGNPDGNLIPLDLSNPVSQLARKDPRVFTFPHAADPEAPDQLKPGKWLVRFTFHFRGGALFHSSPENAMLAWRPGQGGCGTTLLGEGLSAT